MAGIGIAGGPGNGNYLRKAAPTPTFFLTNDAEPLGSEG